MVTFLLAFLGSVLGTIVTLKLFLKERVSTTTYIHCPKGIPKNVSRVLKEQDECLKIMKRINKQLDKLEKEI